MSDGTPLETAHEATARLRAALRDAYEAADHLCTVLVKAKNGAADQAFLNRVTRQVNDALTHLAVVNRSFNAVCIRVRDGEVIRDGNGRELWREVPAADALREDGPGSDGSAA